MQEIRLNKLMLRDFQGGTMTLDAGGMDVSIFGANASGKTRIVSAFCWLLFGKDSLNRADFQIKNLDSQGEAVHGLEHTIEAELDVDGRIITLRRTYSEKWAKKRGSANREFTGHSTQFFIDGVPIQEKEYNARIAELTGDESRFRLLTSPTAFPALPWQRQRSILLDVCGDLTDSDVILSNDKLAPLKDILGKRTMDDHRKVVTARRAEINKEIEKIPIRVDECRRGIPDVTGLDRRICETEVQTIETSLNDTKLRLQGINTGGNVSSLMARSTRINLELREMEENHRKGSLSTLNRLNQRISEIEAQLSTSRSQTKRIEGEIGGKEKQGQRIDASLVDLRDKWALIDSEVFQDVTTLTCAACSQALPVDRVQAAREKALARFNEDKAERLKAVIEKGAALKEEKQRISGELEAIKTEKGILDEKIPRYEADLKQTTEDRDALKRNSDDFSGIQGRAELLDEIEDIEIQIKGERDGKTEDMNKLQIEIAKLNTELLISKGKVDAFVRREQGEKRIEELMAEEKALSKEFERLEAELWLIETFIKTKVGLLTDKINGKFETVRFKLFTQLISGGVEECCEITVGGVPFSGGLNNAGRINAGLEIVKVLQEHHKLRVPVFADNAEAVNSLVNVGCQMIRLYVSEDRQLRIETEAITKHRKAA